MTQPTRAAPCPDCARREAVIRTWVADFNVPVTESDLVALFAALKSESL